MLSLLLSLDMDGCHISDPHIPMRTQYACVYCSKSSSAAKRRLAFSAWYRRRSQARCAFRAISWRRAFPCRSANPDADHPPAQVTPWDVRNRPCEQKLKAGTKKKSTSPTPPRTCTSREPRGYVHEVGFFVRYSSQRWPTILSSSCCTVVEQQFVGDGLQVRQPYAKPAWRST